MKCEDALLLISGHLDKENTMEEEKALQAHLSACEDCRSILQAFEETDLELSALNGPAPEGLCADVMAQIKKETAKKKRRPWYGIAIAAALTVVIGMGAVMGYPSEKDEPQTVSAAETYTMNRSASMDGDALAARLSHERGAAVAVVHELYCEIETYPCETLEEGYVLYTLPDYNAAVFLSENYGCVLFEPAGKANEAASYALLVP